MLFLSIFFQFLIIIILYYDLQNIKKYIKYFDIIYVLFIILGIYIIESNNFNLFVIFLLIITLVTRTIFDKCLFFILDTNYKKNLYYDFGFLILLIIYIYKYCKLKNN